MGLEKYVSFSKQNRQINLCENIFHPAKKKRGKKKLKMNGLAFYIARKHKINTIKVKKTEKSAHRDAHFSIWYVTPLNFHQDFH